jgi:hypothetical protein
MAIALNMQGTSDRKRSFTRSGGEARRSGDQLFCASRFIHILTYVLDAEQIDLQAGYHQLGGLAMLQKDVSLIARLGYSAFLAHWLFVLAERKTGSGVWSIS